MSDQVEPEMDADAAAPDRSRSPQSIHEGEALQRVLAHRRWFVEEASAPGMNTFNGIGTSLHGSAERDADGSYIAKLFFTIFFVPIWPISEYLVQRAESRGGYFFRRVPMSLGSRARGGCRRTGGGWARDAEVSPR
jgi:hypothetical protein